MAVRRGGIAILVLALASAVAGCAPYVKDFYSEAPPTARADVVQVRHDVVFRPDDQYMSDANGRVVDEFLGMIGFDPRQDRVVVLDRDGQSPWSAQRTDSVRAHLQRRQILAEAGIGGPETLGLRDTVTVIVERYVLAPLDCPNWTQPRGGNAANATHRNFGCFDAYNLGQLVANRRDLVVGRGHGTADGEIHALQVLRYRLDVKPPGEPYAKPLLVEGTLSSGGSGGK